VLVTSILGTPVLTQANFPNDVDTSSLGITIFGQPKDVANLVMDKMLQNLSPDGVIQVRKSIHCGRKQSTG